MPELLDDTYDKLKTLKLAHPESAFEVKLFAADNPRHGNRPHRLSISLGDVRPAHIRAIESTKDELWLSAHDGITPEHQEGIYCHIKPKIFLNFLAKLLPQATPNHIFCRHEIDKALQEARGL